MIPPIAAAFKAQALAGGAGEIVDHVEADRLVTGAVKRGLGPLGIGRGLIPNGLEAGDAVLEHHIVLIDHAAFDRVIEAAKALVGLGDSLVEFGKVLAAALGAVFTAVKQIGEDRLQPLGLEQAFLHAARHEIVELVHRDRAAICASPQRPPWRVKKRRSLR